MSDYHSTDSHTFREWDAKQDALRKRLKKMKRFVPPPVQEQPTEQPCMPHEDRMTIEVGHRPAWDDPMKAEMRAVCSSRGAILGTDGNAYPQHVWDWVHMKGDPVHIGRVLMAACDAYLEQMEADHE